MKRRIDYVLVAQLTEKLKLTIVNEPELEARLAVDKLIQLLRKPEFWASDWSEK